MSEQEKVAPKPCDMGLFRDVLVHNTDYGHDRLLTLVFGKPGDLERFPTRCYLAMSTRGDTQQDIAAKLRKLADMVERGHGEQLC